MILLIFLSKIFISDVIGQNKVRVIYPDSLKQSKLYFSPYTIYNSMPALQSIINVGEPFDSTLTFSYSYDDNIEEGDSSRTIAKKQKGLTIIVDTTQEVDQGEYFIKTHKENRLYLSPKKITLLNAKNQATIIPCDKDTFLILKSIPVYILNNTSKTKAVYLKGAFIDIIQEALDKKGKWRPIETSRMFKCGMGFGWRELASKEFIITNIIKYKGSYKTLLRLKFRNGKTIYYSQPFTGSINYSQLNSNSIKYIDGLPYEK